MRLAFPAGYDTIKTYRCAGRAYPGSTLCIRGLHMDIQVGDIIKMKKQHPCGSFEWEVLRIGIDFRLKCSGCGHMIMIPRKEAEKNIKSVGKK